MASNNYITKTEISREIQKQFPDMTLQKLNDVQRAYWKAVKDLMLTTGRPIKFDSVLALKNVEKPSKRHYDGVHKSFIYIPKHNVVTAHQLGFLKDLNKLYLKMSYNRDKNQ